MKHRLLSLNIPVKDTMLKKKDILEAAKAFDSTRYPLDFYNHHLAVLKRAKKLNASVKDSVRELFKWRMGKIRNTKFKAQLSDTAKPTSFTDSEGNVHYASAITAITERSIQRATSEELLKKGLSFRDHHLSFGELTADARNISRTSVYLPCFFVHLWRPDEYPLFEKKVWVLRQSEWDPDAEYSGVLNSMSRYLEYVDWFNDLIQKKKIDRLTAQLGLWELGRRLEARK